MSTGQFAAGSALTDRLKCHGVQGCRRALLLTVITVCALLTVITVSAVLWDLRACTSAVVLAGHFHQKGKHEAPLLNLPGVKDHHRLRLSRLRLDKGDLWMATPDWADQRHPHIGADWYEQAWQSSRFNYADKVCGQHCLEKILSVVPCTKDALVFQAGAHLGVFPFMGMALGCSGLSIEGNAIHIPFMKLNAYLNGFQDRFTVINRIVGAEDNAQGLSFEGQSVVSQGTSGAVVVPMVKLDTVFKQYGASMPINLAIVDTEGYENSVLQGAHDLVKNRRVAAWVIEVWYRQNNRDVTALPGLKLLVDNGYLIFDINLKLIGVSPADVKTMLDTYCAKPGPRSNSNSCLMDHLAVRTELADKVVSALQEM